MPKTIAVAGKGGTGKTTISALLSLYLSQKGVVLAIDGDPSSNLNLALGMPLRSTVGDVREEMTVRAQAGQFSPGVAKSDYLDARIRSAVAESDKIDLLAMGRPEGPGCYCASNNFLRASIDQIGKSYDYIVIDNEAGMEHISRQTTRDVDLLIIVSDPTIRGIVTAGRVKDLIAELRTYVGRVVLVVNLVQGALSEAVEKAIAEHGLDLAAVIPSDPSLAELDANGKPFTALADDSPLKSSVWALAQKLGL